MNNTKLSALALMIFSSTMCYVSAYASQEQCPSDVVHCAYITGISDNVNDGRYIKLYNPKAGSIVVCFNGSSTASISQDSAGNYRGTNSDAYSICPDGSGKNCEQVGVDNFFISNSNNEFTAEPKYFNVDLSALKNKYPACNSLDQNQVKL